MHNFKESVLVDTHCFECGSHNQSELIEGKVICPVCQTVNDCIIEGYPTESWIKKHGDDNSIIKAYYCTGMKHVSILHVSHAIHEKERESLTRVHAKIQNSETKNRRV